MPYNQKPLVPKGLKTWNLNDVSLSPQEIVSRYEHGFAGCIYSEAEREATLDSMEEPDGEKIAYQHGFVGNGQGKLTMLWQYAQKQWNVWPKPAQTTGNCVGKAGANIGILLIGIDVVSNTPDEETGKVEGWPELSAVAVKNGVVADEPIYGDRGHAGQGASCDRLIRHMTDWGGVVLRQNYPGIIDLEETDTAISIKWGRSQTPAKVRELGKSHQIRNATSLKGHEQVRDYVSVGCPIWVCSGLGWSSKRDENGYSKQSGSWSHSWVVDGYDDRSETIQKYGFPLFHYNHDWGKWNGGGRVVLGTQDEIPEGSFWGDARLLDRCDLTAMNSVNGWPRRNLPDFYVPGVFT